MNSALMFMFRSTISTSFRGSCGASVGSHNMARVVDAILILAGLGAVAMIGHVAYLVLEMIGW